MDADALLEGLDPDQRRAVTSPAAPLVVIAPAGSGKTRVLTRRIAHRVALGEADARHVLALTFTRKAARQLTVRLHALGLRDRVAAATFHAAAWGQLRTWWLDRDRTPPTLLDRKGRLLHDLVPRATGRDRRTTAGELATEIEWAKARGIGPDAYEEAVAAARRRTPLSARAVAERYAAYEARKREGRLVDFDDVLANCTAALRDDERFAAAQRWRFRHLFVDELQDINPLQFALLEAWRGNRYDVCAVGDPQQAIYGWNGADPRFLREVHRYWPGAEVIELTRSYRSTPQILGAAAEVLRAAGQTGTEVVAAQAAGPAPALVEHATDRAEAVAIARAVRLAHPPGRPWAEQAVLVRTHGQVALVTEALRGARIPHRVRGAATSLDDPTTRRVLHDLRASGPDLATALADLETDLATREADDATRDAATTVLAAGRDFLHLDPGSTVPAFLGWLQATVRREGGDDQRDAVDVATFHAAKGLEWAIVHLAGVEDGYVPIAHARTAAARAEEARLLYVAMTRARQQLRISWARERVFAAKVVDRRRSPLLHPLAGRDTTPAGHRAEGVGTSPAADAAPDPSWRERLAEQRAVLAGHRHSRTPAQRALAAWRDTTARAARAAPESVLPDAVLDRIAAAAPRDVDDLRAVAGVGPVLAHRFGPALLAALHAAEPAPADAGSG